jgi:hypothetical protein
VAALVGGTPSSDGAIGDLLQIEVERGVDAQAGLMHLFGAEVLFELAADFFLEPGSDALGLGDVQAERRFARGFGLRVGDDAVGLHLTEDEVAAAQRFLGIEERRKGDGAFGQAGEQRGLGQREVFGVLGEVELRGGLKAVHAAAEVDLVAVEGEDLLLGEGALDLDGEIGLLTLRAVVRSEERKRLRASCMVSVEAPWARPWERMSCQAAPATRKTLMPQCDSKFLSSMEMTAWRRTGAKSS